MSEDAARVWTQLTRSRASVRDFRPDPVPEGLLAEILEEATCAPSWSNTQPYRLAVASGELRDRISADLCARYDAAVRAQRGGPVQKVQGLLRSARPDGDFGLPLRYPDDLNPARVESGRALYGVLGIARGDRAARDRQMRRNFEFFGAPTAVFVFVHSGLHEFAVLDAGVMLQNLMLAAHARGLGTCAQGALATWAGPVRARFEVPDAYRLICGLSIGYASDAPVNGFRPGRAPVSDVLVPARD